MNEDYLNKITQKDFVTYYRRPVMGWLAKTIFSSVGKKLIMGLTGLFLVTFLLVHLAGNFALLRSDGGAAFDAYSHFMSTNPLIRILEIGLVLGFLLHIIDGVMVWYGNKMARPQGYAVNHTQENSSFFSRTMIWSGALIFVFLVIHLMNFLVSHRLMGDGSESMYVAVKQVFEMEGYAAFYILSMVLLAFHLNHGFQSAFQTLGLNHKKYTPLIKAVGLIYSVLVPLGYAFLPAFFLVKKYLNL